MKISTKGRYGLRAVIDIAIHGDSEPVSLSDIAVREDISVSYLEQLIAKLRRADIVTSVRGAKGGYSRGAGGPMGIERAVVKQVKYRDVRKHDIIGGEIACHENQCTYRNQNGKYQPNPCYDFFGW